MIRFNLERMWFHFSARHKCRISIRSHAFFSWMSLQNRLDVTHQIRRRARHFQFLFVVTMRHELIAHLIFCILSLLFFLAKLQSQGGKCIFASGERFHWHWSHSRPCPHSVAFRVLFSLLSIWYVNWFVCRWTLFRGRSSAQTKYVSIKSQ